jgi:hypothetical protein
MSRSNQIRIGVLLALGAVAAALLLASHEYHKAVLLRLAVYLITAIGVLALLFWLTRNRLLWGWLTLGYAFISSLLWWIREIAFGEFAEVRSLFSVCFSFSVESNSESSLKTHKGGP